MVSKEYPPADCRVRGVCLPGKGGGALANTRVVTQITVPIPLISITPRMLMIEKDWIRAARDQRHRDISGRRQPDRVLRVPRPLDPQRAAADRVSVLCHSFWKGKSPAT